MKKTVDYVVVPLAAYAAVKTALRFKKKPIKKEISPENAQHFYAELYALYR